MCGEVITSQIQKVLGKQFYHLKGLCLNEATSCSMSDPGNCKSALSAGAGAEEPGAPGVLDVARQGALSPGKLNGVQRRLEISAKSGCKDTKKNRDPKERAFSELTSQRQRLDHTAVAWVRPCGSKPGSSVSAVTPSAKALAAPPSSVSLPLPAQGLGQNDGSHSIC